MYAEKDVKLTLKCEAGSAQLTLSQDLGHVLSERPLYPQHPRNWPSQQRCRARRAEACSQQAAGEAVGINEETEQVSVEKVVEKPSADKALEKSSVQEAVAAEKAVSIDDTTVISKEVEDEICNYEEYVEQAIIKKFPKTFLKRILKTILTRDMMQLMKWWSFKLENTEIMWD